VFNLDLILKWALKKKLEDFPEQKIVRFINRQAAHFNIPKSVYQAIVLDVERIFHFMNRALAGF